MGDAALCGGIDIKDGKARGKKEICVQNKLFVSVHCVVGNMLLKGDHQTP